MQYFILTILLNVIISALLKLFGRYRVDSLQAIVINYIVCVVTGCVFTGNVPFNAATIHAPWLPWTLFMGLAFIAIFNLMAHCAQVNGITSMVLANKLSLVIPVICALWMYNEHAGAYKIAGIVLAFPAVYLTAHTGQQEGGKGHLFWPALLFFVSGGLDTLVNYIQAAYLHTHEVQAACTIICFATAACAGIILLSVLVARGKAQITMRNVVAGICLGVPNFFSIFFLVKALHCGAFESSATIPLLNISILVASSVVAMAFFGERAGKWRMAGLALAVIAILLIAYGD